MAQKKKKGKPPNTKEVKRKKLSASQIIFSILSIIMVLSMILPYLLR
ncbi:MAG: hypothetical protein ABFS17_11055 [Chloroflexota bacterium]